MLYWMHVIDVGLYSLAFLFCMDAWLVWVEWLPDLGRIQELSCYCDMEDGLELLPAAIVLFYRPN